jgi:hypothetical protein
MRPREYSIKYCMVYLILWYETQVKQYIVTSMGSMDILMEQ